METGGNNITLTSRLKKVLERVKGIELGFSFCFYWSEENDIKVKMYAL